MSVPPNIVYLHAHDAGRFVQPYGYPVETPHVQSFAEQSTLFRKAFCIAPTCGPSRAALTSGQYPHQIGMYGLPGSQGWEFDDYRKHWVQHFNRCGYETVLAGVQHEANHADISCLGYQRVLEAESPARDQVGEFYPETIDKVEQFFARRKNQAAPFFISIGIDEPHRDNIPRPELKGESTCRRFSKTRDYDPDDLDSRYTAPPPWLPDIPAIRKDMESFREGLRIMDEYMGRVFASLDLHNLTGSTLVILTSDHGIEFPGGKKTLSDQGLQVMLMMRGPGIPVGQVLEGMVTHLDIFPTLCERIGRSPDHTLEGKSLLPMMQGKEPEPHQEIYAQQTYHGSMEPLRCIRTERYKYIIRDHQQGPKMKHDGPTTPIMEQAGWYNRHTEKEELYDLYLDPMEACNRIHDSSLEEKRNELKTRLVEWMEKTNDPFLSGDFPPPPLR